MKVIGFTTKYYTLWDIYSEEISGRDGRKGKKVTATYLKNISTDLESAKARHPEATLDMNLHGTRSWNRTAWEPLPMDVFHGGRYRGQSIAECSDLEYLFWAYCCSFFSNEEQRDIAKDVLLRSGLYVMYKDRLLKEAEATRLEAEDTEIQELCDTLTAGGAITVDNENGIHLDENTEDRRFVSFSRDGRIILVWPEDMLVEHEYYGHRYWMPVKKDKGVRIKNREINVTATRCVIFTGDWGPDRLEVAVSGFSVVPRKKEK